ncbi:uncharacterized protein LOC110455320 [Mizuhopecten yessoensis]|uniref:Inter-alpha-trypsin inhibitor heavy chain C-terminal domain-containing protein n=1 Tax=Mizuhopecten yessoensis TaxID=6573 RepID=A0A210R4G1_MIZYE|nr:uncharacterized protein LOC110455320 [Mizuhopecten yessoensis]OWF55794.1 hypothetical protein KP79_PYT10835 [Mizuhopecten yessoensis]
MVINAAIVPTGILREDMHLKTYMGEIFIRVDGTIIVVTPRQIITNSSFSEWTDGTPVAKGKFFLQASDDGNILTIKTDYDVIVVIRRHLSSIDEPIDYLNVHIESDAGLSSSSSGILGHLVKKKVSLRKITEKNGRTIGRFRVEDDATVSHFHARLHMKHDFISDENFMCWNAIHDIDGLFRGKLKTFELKGFFT